MRYRVLETLLSSFFLYLWFFPQLSQVIVTALMFSFTMCGILPGFFLHLLEPLGTYLRCTFA